MKNTTPSPTSWKRFLGDSDSIQLHLTGIDILVQASEVLATFTNTKTDVTAPIVTGSVLSETDHTVTIPLTGFLADVATVPGRYDIKIRIENTTWPEEGLAWLDVEARPAPAP
jgi:hypothetical protein